MQEILDCCCGLDLHKESIVALARKLLVIIFAMLKFNSAYDGQKFLKRKEANEQEHISRMIHELTKLGYTVSLPA